jgi:hypothetical protein
MDLSQLKWLKNVKPDQGWAYDKLNEMPIPEARIFRLNWRKDKDNAQKPLKGDLIALVQSAKVTHLVELLDDVVYGNAEKEWGIYRVVKAVWMPLKDLIGGVYRIRKKFLGSKTFLQIGLYIV